jgi:hypothetical protein
MPPPGVDQYGVWPGFVRLNSTRRPSSSIRIARAERRVITVSSQFPVVSTLAAPGEKVGAAEGIGESTSRSHSELSAESGSR